MNATIAAIAALAAAALELISKAQKLCEENNVPEDELVAELAKNHQITNTDPEKVLELIKGAGG